MNSSGSSSMFGKLSGLFKGKKSLKKQLNEYMEFYYPAKTQFTYDIIFDWGEYIITTEDPKGTVVHQDSVPYLGFITMRPKVEKPAAELITPFYVITPEGLIWENTTGVGIAEIKTRQVVTEKRVEHGVSRTTLTINSVSEPLIDHFKKHPEKWTKYGQLEIVNGKTKLKLQQT